MFYKAVEVIWIFSVGRVDRPGTEGTIRGPRRNKNIALGWWSIKVLLDLERFFEHSKKPSKEQTHSKKHS